MLWSREGFFKEITKFSDYFKIKMYIHQNINKRHGTDKQGILSTHIIWFVSKIHKECLCTDTK